MSKNPKAPKAPKQWPEWFRVAWAEAPVDDDGNRALDVLKKLAHTNLLKLPGEADAMAEARVSEFIREVKRGLTQPASAQMCLPGLDPELWRPDQLYTHKGMACRAEEAKPAMLVRHSERTMANARVQIQAAERIQKRANQYTLWFTEEVIKGRSPGELTQGVWLRESGYLVEVPDDDSPEPDDPEST